MPLLYTTEGDIHKLHIKHNYESDFIRKMLKEEDITSRVELKIAGIIQKNPHENIVKVFKVCKSPMYIDYQLLDTEYTVKKKNYTAYVDNIRQGIIHLHNLNIVYIDFKKEFGDNVGYDRVTKTYKIYDFDVSGVLKKHKREWCKNYAPPKYGNYKEYMKKCSIKNDQTTVDICKKKELTKIDELLFYLYYHETIY